MPFVKLDCGMINSTIWFDRPAREIFLTALLMAEPHEVTEPIPQIAVNSLDHTGWEIPPGWYGFVHASGPGIIDRAKVTQEEGRPALVRLGEPELESRSQDFSGRRLVRVDGGYVVLNFMKYRERDYSAAERSAKYRRRKAEKLAASRVTPVTSRVIITQAEAEAEAEADPDTKEQEDQNIRSRAIKPRAHLNSSSALFDVFWSHYPRKVAKSAALKAWGKLKVDESLLTKILSGLEWQRHQPQWAKDNGLFVPHASTWLNQRRWEDEPFSISDPTEAAWGRVMARRGKLQ